MRQQYLQDSERIHKTHMKAALTHAEAALTSGEFPVGCLITLDDTVVATGTRTNSSGEATNEIDHAEIIALRHLSRTHPGINLNDAVLYCTLEPCLMCFAAILLSGIRTIVYAYEDAMGGGTRLHLSDLPPLYSSAHPTIIPGILRHESLSLFKRFFNSPGNRYWKNSYLEKYTLETS